MNTEEIPRKIRLAVTLNCNRRGIVAAVTEAMVKAGHKAHRQEVQVWLHPEPDKRIEPRLTTGLALAEACGAVLARHKREPFPAKEAK
jgi:hypothetical protein